MLGVTLLVLFLLTGSVVGPIKAVLTNLVSISASFGALVWTFQDGHLQHVLGFTPQPLGPAIPVLLFAAVFGLSMDYEVLLVTRIQEQHLAAGNNDYASVVRALVVPSVMRLMGEANWWAPGPLRRLHHLIGVHEGRLSRAFLTNR